MATAVVVTLGPARVDLVGVRAGDRNLVAVTLTRDGAPLDLAGLTITAQARKTATDPAIAIEAGVEVIDAAAGRLELDWPGDEVETALAGATSWTGVWDLQLDGGPDGILTVAAGTFRADADVTRP